MNTITNTSKSQVPLVDYIGMKQETERKVSLEITHKERLAARDALVHCRNIKKQPLNVLISFEFPQDQQNISNDIKKIRYCAHMLRMIFQRDNERESLLAWTRTTVPGSGIEKCTILTHCPDKKLVAFTRQILGWKGFPNLAVEPVDPEKADRLRNGRYVSVFEEMYAATDHWSRAVIKDVYTEVSGPIRGPRTFCSFKLNKRSLINHQRQAEKQKQLELFKGFGMGDSETVSLEK